MERVNRSRILFAGMLGGMIVNTGEFLLHRIVLNDDWAGLLPALKGPPQHWSGEFAVLSGAGFLMGVLVAWLCAALRPRFASGTRAALAAAAAVWLPCYAVVLAALLKLDRLPAGAAPLSLAGGFVELALAAALAVLIYAADGASEGSLP